MADSFKKPHLKIKDFSENKDYKYPNKNIRVDFKNPPRDRKKKGKQILSQLTKVKESFENLKKIEKKRKAFYPFPYS